MKVALEGVNLDILLSVTIDVHFKAFPCCVVLNVRTVQ